MSIDLVLLADRIGALPAKDHEPIYYILKKNNVKITISESNVLFLATSCSESVLEEINKIVTTCYENMMKEQKYEQKYKSIESEIVRANIESGSKNPDTRVFQKNEVVEMNYYNRAKLDKMKKQDEERLARNKNIRQSVMPKHESADDSGRESGGEECIESDGESGGE
jgi:ribonuclease HIII